MSDFGDAMGTAVEGGLFAKAIDGRANGDSGLEDGHFAEGQCLNCGTTLVGSHCHACGQKARLHRAIGAFLHDLLHGALHFEGKTWHTLPKLVFKPGELTRRYIDGERARFVSPMALFLFTIFLMFAVFQVAGITTPTELDTGDDVVATAQEAQDALRAELAAVPIDEAERRAELEQEIAGIDEAIELIRTGKDYAFTDSEGREVSARTNLTGIDTIDEGIIAKWRANPGLMLYKLQTNFYKFSWLLIPLSVPFVWVLFAWRRQFKAYDHAIFVTYSLCFMTLLILVVTALAKLGVMEAIYGSLLFLVPPVHIYKHLRGTYALTRFSTLWRLCALTIFTVIVLGLFLQLLLLLGAF